MSLSRWTASTCGVAAIAVCGEHESGEQRQRGEKSPQNGRHHGAPQPTIAGATGFKANEERADTVRLMRAFSDRSGASARGPGGCACRRCVDLEPRPVARQRARSGGGSRSGKRFDLVGVHWRGSGRVELRTRAASGAWSPWRTRGAGGRGPARPRRARALAGSAGRSATRGGRPARRGSRCARSARVTRVRAWFVRSPSARVPLRTVAFAGSPKIVPRSGWKADEKIVRAAPRYAPVLRFAVVHHTAGSSAYRPEESAAIVRGIELYHVKANGWNDIGYNFLVDRYGQVFEGRGGGMQRNVIGAHAEGFNTGSVGIAVIGTYSGKAPTRRGRGRPGSAARMAPRRRPRRSCLVGDGHVGRQCEGAGRRRRLPSGHLRTPGRRLHGLPRQRASTRGSGSCARWR